MQDVIRDLRFGIRLLAKKRSFTLTSVLIIALAIGASTIIFSAVNAVLLRPLPFKEPDRLIMLWEENRQLNYGLHQFPASPANFVDWRDRNKSLDGIAAFRYLPFNLTGVDDPERIEGSVVSANLMSLLGVAPLMGRDFSEQDETPSGSHVVILSYSTWQDRFKSDPNMIGRVITLNDQPYTVVGVMPPGFNFPRKTDLSEAFQRLPRQTNLWAPLVITNQELQVRGSKRYGVIARLKPGISIRQAQLNMDSIAGELEQQYPSTNTNWSIKVIPFYEQVVGRIRPLLWLLMAAVLLVLIIACANLANLLLTHSTGRQKEFAVRLAIGANRSDIIRQLLIENITLSLIGGALGFAVAYVGVNALLPFLPPELPRAQEINLDKSVVICALFLSLLTGVLFSLVPAIRATKVNLNDVLKASSTTTSGHRNNRTRNLLAVSELALTLMLLIGAGLLVKSFAHLLKEDPGFRPEKVLTMEIDLPVTRYPDYNRVVSFYKQVLDQVSTLPGVESVAATSALPLSGGEQSVSYSYEGEQATDSGEGSLAIYSFIMPDYFQVMGIPLRGRAFTYQDEKDKPGVVIINEALASRCWPGENPLGKHLTIGAPREVVGVVKNVKHSALEERVKPELFLPFTQVYNHYMVVVLRTESDPLSLAAALTKRVHDVDKDQPVANIKTMGELMSVSVARSRFSMFLMTVFAAVAFVLALVGIYGVISYAVTQRTHEIGIRIALGAQPKQVLSLILMQGVRLSIIGVGIGVASAFVLTRLISSLLYNVSATDPAIFALISVALIAAATLASYIPARRAVKIDPLLALRYE
jgi:predicted permease